MTLKASVYISTTVSSSLIFSKHPAAEQHKPLTSSRSSPASVYISTTVSFSLIFSKHPTVEQHKPLTSSRSLVTNVMFYFVYILRNPKGSFYIGYSNNLKRRLKEHQQGQVYTTRRLGGPWKLIYFECCIHKWDAQKRENFLKTGSGRAFLKKRLKYFLN